MVNNFANTEKSLKRWLKTKVSVTAATVVGFLIAGTVAFGAAAGEEAEKPEVKNNVTIAGIKENESVGVTEITDALFTKDNVGVAITQKPDRKTAILATKGEDQDGKVTAKGNLLSKNKKSWLMTINPGVELTIAEGTVLNGENIDRTTLNQWGNTTVVNKGTIEKAAEGWAAMTISGAEDGNIATFTNNGSVKGAINVEDNVRLVNTGVIEGAIYADKTDGKKEIVLKDGSKIESIELLDSYSGNNSLTIENNKDTIEWIEGIAKIDVVKNSDITIKDGYMSRELTSENKHIVNVENSNLDINMEITAMVGDTGSTIGTSNLINNYGKEKGSYTLISRGELISDQAASGIYTNANAENVTMNVTNEGNIDITGNSWATGLNGKFDSGIKNATINMTNNGIIAITNGAGMDITNGGDKSNIGIAKNAEDASINVSGFGVGILVDGQGMKGVNNGYIVMTDAAKGGKESDLLSYGMQAKNGAYVENNGTIVVAHGDLENVKAMGVEPAVKAEDAVKSSGVNNGKVKLSDITGLEEIAVPLVGNISAEEYLNGILFDSAITNNGMIVNKFGESLFADANIGNKNDLTGSELSVAEIVAKDGIESSITVGKGGTTIEGAADNNTITTGAFNVSGEVNITKPSEGNNTSVIIKDTTTNLDINGIFNVAEGAELKFDGGTVNGEEDGMAVNLGDNSKLALNGTNFNGNVTGNGAIAVDSSNVTGEISAKTLVTGVASSNFDNLFSNNKANLLATEEKPVESYVGGTTIYNDDVYTSENNDIANGTAIFNGKVIVSGDSNGIRIGAEANGADALAVFNGDVYSNSIKLGAVEGKKATAFYSADSKLLDKEYQTSKGTAISGGINIFEVAEDGKNALLNTSLALNKENKEDDNNKTGVSIAADSGVQLSINVDKNMEIDLGVETVLNNNEVKLTEESSDFYDIEAVKESNNKFTLSYKDNIASENGFSSKLDGLFAGSQVIHSILNANGLETVGERAVAFDKLYGANIYSETVKMSMDTLRMNEDAVLSLNAEPEVGKWAATGKVLYSNTEYDRDGEIRDYNVETETTGLMGAVEYGVDETTTVGFAFSGTKQDVDMDHAKADGDAFYFGAYANKNINNIKLTAGLGYQINSIEADNNVITATGDDYDSDAFSGYVQGKYILEAGEGFTVEPKAKLTLTKLTQDSVKDDNFKMEEVEATTFDVEVGVDAVKTVALDKAKMNLLAGVSYTRTMGDTDDKYEGNFYNGSLVGHSFDVMGANLGENTFKLNVGAEVEHDNGFFYNGGVAYRFDNEDRDSFGVNVGAGYKF